MADVNDWLARREALIERLRENPHIPDWCELHTAILDELITGSCEAVLRDNPQAPPISIVATGGYGRKELAPYSDIDITVVPLEDAAPGLDPAVRGLFRTLHQEIGQEMRMEIGYAYRLVNDAPGLDEKSRTALLDARLVCGSPEPLDALMNLFWDTFPIGDFLISKIEERNAKFRSTNDTPLAAEPQLKEGAGGLRCFQTANWLRMAIGERPMRPTKAYHFMLQLRNLLHLAAGRKQDTLTRQRQAEIADRLERDVFDLMSECASFGLELKEELEQAAEKLLEGRFSLGGGVMAIRGEARMMGKGTASAAAAGVANATQLGLRVPRETFSTSGPIDSVEALAALSAGEDAIRNLEKCGLLTELLPELVACKTAMPQDPQHRYTVYEHTLRAIRALQNVPPDSFMERIKTTLFDISKLYLAILLHDVGKLTDPERHSEAGAEIALSICKRWNAASSLSDDVVWLVREHLTMAHFITMRDVANPATAQEFAQVVGSQERLDLLTLLTFADTSAVSPLAWTVAQENLVIELYRRTSSCLEGNSMSSEDPSAYRRRIMRELKSQPISELEVQAFLDSMPTHYLASTPVELVPIHLKYEQRASRGEPVLELHNEPNLMYSELTVCTLDRPGLLSQILGVIYAYDLGIHTIRASTSSSFPAVALDIFDITFGGKPLPRATASRMIEALRKSLQGERPYEEILRDMGKDPNREQQTFTYKFLEGSPAILEIQAPRGRGMAFRISRLIARKGWNITAARVGQWAGLGAAAFYLHGKRGHSVTREEIDGALITEGKG